MVKDSENQQSKSPEQQDAERHVKQLMGPSASEASSSIKDDAEDQESERILVIPDRSDDNSSQTTPVVDRTTAKTDVPTGTESVKKSGKIKRFFRKWWHDPKLRNPTIIALVVALAGVFLFPTTRYFLLNNVGIRSSAQVTVIDNSTQLPLRNVQVKLANATGVTDGDGKVKLEHLKLGSTNLIIEKRAFATFSKPVTIGWGSNPLGDYPITPTGIQFAFSVKDWLSSQPIDKAEAISGLASAFSDTDGKILLTIDPADVQDSMIVNISADGYRTEQIPLNPDVKDAQPVNMVLSRKAWFISNRSGRHDLYVMDIDGKNEKQILKGTGLERDEITLVPHPTDEVAVLVSSRINARNADGYLLDTLALVNLDENIPTTIAQSESIQIIGWVGSRLLFVQIAAGSSASDPDRFKLLSYDYKTATPKELASANAFNDVVLANSNVYWSPSGTGSKDESIGLFRASADGSNKKTLLDKEVWNIFRIDYDNLNLSVGDDWYEYKLGNTNATKLNEGPSDPKNRIYISSSDNNHNLWVDERDGEGVLLNYDHKTNEENIVKSQGGITYPIRWLTNTTFIYRLDTSSETADYVMSLDGGKPHKIVNVYETKGIDRWFFY